MATLKHVWAGASVLATLLTWVLAASGQAASPSPIHDAFPAKSTSMVVEFYYHFTPPSEEQVVPPAVPGTIFGEIDMYDVRITNTSDPNSTEIGRGYGTLFFDEPLLESGFENKVSLVFNNNSGFPPNSSINIEGFEPWNLPPEGYNYSAVGGTGAFACARGVVTDIIFAFNATAGTTTAHDFAYLVVGCGFNRRNAFYLFE